MATNFVEQATMTLETKQAERSARRLNGELDKLFATANKLKSVKIDIKGLSQASSQARTLQRDLQKLASTKMPAIVAPKMQGAIPKLPTITNAQVTAANQYAAAMTKIAAASNRVKALPAIPVAPVAQGAGRSRMGSTSGRVPNMTPRLNPASARSYGQQIADGFNSRINDGEGVGRTIAGGFLTAIGGRLHNIVTQAVSTAGRSAGRGIISTDDARSLAAGAGIQDVAGLERQALASSERFKGTNVGDIMDASIEQIASLQAQLNKGTITNEQYIKSSQRITDRIARSAQVYTTMGQTSEQAAEDARELEKALVVLGKSADPQQAENFANSITKAQIATGGDVSSAEAKRSFGQLGGTIASGLSESGAISVLLARDETGARSTAEIRTFMEGLTRQNKTEKDMAKQTAAGLRTSEGATTLSAKDFADPVNLVFDKIIPKLEKLGVNLDDATAVNTALQANLGMTTTEARFPTATIVNRKQIQQEQEKAGIADPESLRQTENLRIEIADVNKAFQNLATEATKFALPAVKGGLGLVTGSLEAATAGDPVAMAKVAAGAIPIALGASMQGLLDPATRAQSAAALSLTGSAVALTGSAAALTASAAAGGIGDAAGGKGFWGKLAARLGIGLGVVGGVNAVSTPDTQLMKDNRLGLGVDDAIKWIFGVNKAMSNLQEGGEGRTDRESVIEIAKTAATTAALKADMGAARVANLDAGLTKPIPVTITNQNLTPVASQQSPAGLPLGAVPDNVGTTLQQSTQTLLTGLDINFAEAQTRFTTTFQTGGDSVANKMTTAAPLVGQGIGAAFGAAIPGLGSQMGAEFGAAAAAAIRSAAAGIRVQVSGAGNTLPSASSANTGATPPVE